MTFWLKSGDLKPSITAVLTDSNGDPVDINGAEVTFVVSDAFSRLPLFQALAENDQSGPTTNVGEVHYDWVLGDTDIPGSYRCEFSVSFADDTIGTFPNDDTIDLEIIPAMVEASS